jgi:hypothetical protein
MNEQDKTEIMKQVGRYTDGVKYNMEIIYSEDTSGLFDFPIFYGVVSSLDEQEEYYYKDINSVDDYWEFIETADLLKETNELPTITLDVISTIN